LVVNRAGDQLLAGAGLAVDADSRSCVDDALERAKDLLHRVGFADDVVEANALLLALEVAVFALNALLGDFELRVELRVVDRQ
jgi:hypothetical protein